MSTVRAKGEKVRRYIVANVSSHPDSIAQLTAKKFGISRQAVSKHIARLVDEKILNRFGNTRNRRYSLCPLVVWDEVFSIEKSLSEDVVWREHVRPHLDPLPDNAMHIWAYGFTEMFNNIIDHSEGSKAWVRLSRTAAATEMQISDNGIGIFKKITRVLGLADERHAVLELAKGKLTTDPSRHSGEGIFFTSRMFDDFCILSGDTFFSHEFDSDEDWILETHNNLKSTCVIMKLNNHTSRNAKKVFDQFSSGENYGFTRTIVPVRMAQYGDDLLVSRSQARRLLERVDRFAVVVFDFSSVKEIGQAFADEVFRVFQSDHPEITLQDIHANSTVKRMIYRARELGSSGDIEGQCRLF